MVLTGKNKVIIVALTALLVIGIGVLVMVQTEPAVQIQAAEVKEQVIHLPSPQHTGDMSVEEAIFQRRSIRHFTDKPLTLQEVSQLLWSAGGKTVDGVTGPTRAFPSAGGLYPFEIYLVVGNVTDLADGIYRFGWREHSLEMLMDGDFREELMLASLRQSFVHQAPISIIWVADFDEVRRVYGQRGVDRYISMDIGGAGQNVHLQSEALGLGTVIVGAFQDEMVKEILGTENIPLYIMPVGRK